MLEYMYFILCSYCLTFPHVIGINLHFHNQRKSKLSNLSYELINKNLKNMKKLLETVLEG